AARRPGARRGTVEVRVTMSGIRNVGVVGAGTMGNGIAHVFAQYGYDVVLVDVGEDRLQRALETIKSNLARQVRRGVLAPEAEAGVLSRIRTTTSLGDVAGAELVVEAASEDMEVKAGIFRELDDIASEDAI